MICLYPDMQVYYRYNIVQLMKTLHLSVLCPELVPEAELSHEPSTKSGKKGEEKSAGKSKEKSGKEKEKKPVPQKIKEEPTEACKLSISSLFVEMFGLPHLSATGEIQQPTKVPDWDLSIASLQEVCTKLKQQCCMVYIIH